MRARLSWVASVVVLSTAVVFAASNRGTATAMIDGKKVSIDYGRPALKGRALGDLMDRLSEDRVWRSGDDQVTTLTTEINLAIGGKKVNAGKYSLYVHVPEDGSHDLLLNTDLGQPLVKLWAQAPDNLKNEPWPYIGNYQAKIGDKEILRAPMTKDTVKAPVETFTIDLTPGKHSATLRLSWGSESWSIDLKTAK